MHGNQDDFRLLVFRSQISNLTPDPSFGHNLCLKCPNGMQAHFKHLRSKSFSMIKRFFQSMGFGPCNRFVKIRESIRTPTPKMGRHLIV
jgi:hypothetical protein